MNIYTSNKRPIDDLFKEASESKPVMNLEEVEQIVTTGRYTSAIGIKGFHIGINTIIVMSGIIVSSFLAYMALKVDNKTTGAEKLKIENTSPAVSENQPTVTDNQVVPSDKIIASSQVAEKERPRATENNLVASTSNKLIATKKAKELKSSNKLSRQLTNESALVAEESKSSSPLEASASVPKKMLSGVFNIQFDYNDQLIKMKLVGNDVSELSIDNKMIAKDKFDDYEELISEGRNILAGKGGSNDETNSLDLIKYFDAQLQQDKIIAADSPYVFELSSSQLLINKTAQNNEAFSKYKKLYETKTGKVVTTGSVYRFERGQK